MRIKKGDKIVVLAGKDKGKQGKVIKALPKTGKIIVEGINLVVKHIKPRRKGEKGQRIKMPAPLYVCKVALVCPKCNKPTRVGYKILEDRSKKRMCKKCKEVFD